MNQIKKFFYINEVESSKKTLSLTCNLDNNMFETSIQKIKYHKEFPQILCNVCKSVASNFSQIKKDAKKGSLEMLSTKNQYITDRHVKVKCVNDHITTIKGPIKHCNICLYDKNVEKYLKVKTSCKITKPEILYENNSVIMKIPKRTIKYTCEGLEMLYKTNIPNLHTFLFNKNYNKYIDENTTILKNTELQISDEVKQVDTELKITHNKMEQTKQKKIIEKPLYENIQIDSELVNKFFIEIVKEKNNFMNNDYEKLENKSSICNNIKNKINKMLFEYSENKKDEKFKQENSDEIKITYETLAGYITKKYQDHLFIKKINSFNTCNNIDTDIFLNFILTTNTTYENNHVIVENDIMLNKNFKDILKRYSDIIETPEEEKFALNYYKTANELLKNVKLFSTENKQFNVIKYINKFKQYNEEDPTISGLLIYEFLSPINKINVENISKELLFTILICLSQQTAFLLGVYFYNNKNYCFDDSFVYYVDKVNKQIKLYTNNSIQKCCFLDSGFLEMYYKIMLNLDEESCFILKEITPYNIWDNTELQYIGIEKRVFLDDECYELIDIEVSKIDVCDIFDSFKKCNKYNIGKVIDTVLLFSNGISSHLRHTNLKEIKAKYII